MTFKTVYILNKIVTSLDSHQCNTWFGIIVFKSAEKNAFVKAPAIVLKTAYLLV